MKNTLSVLLLALAFTAAAQDLSIPHTKYTLDNGLTLIVHEDHKAPIVAVNVWYHVGSKNERVGKTGFAHLFEHLMFNGSENYNDDWFKPFDQVGATGMNGTTNQDRTNYFQVVPKNALDMTLWMESDRMGHLLGAIDQAKLDEQRGVVQNEKRQGENQPYGKVFYTILQNVYPKAHPYSWSVIGSMEDLNAASLDDVHEWFNSHYGAANATLVIAGDVYPEEVKAKVEKYFGDIQPGPPQIKQKAWIGKRSGKHSQTMYDRVPQARVYKIWNIPQWGTLEADQLGLVSGVLASDKRSRLYKRLVYDEKVASDVSAFSFNSEISGLFGIVVTALKQDDLAYIETAIDEELHKFMQKGPDKAELERVKTAHRAGFIRRMERVGGFGGKSDLLAQNQVFGNEPNHHLKQIERTADATSKELMAAAKSWLSDGEYMLEVLPFDDYKATAQGVDRSKGLPSVGDSPEVAFDDLQRATLSNGLRVVLAERHAVPVVRMRLMIDAGFAADAQGKAGTANLAMDMLDEGAGKLSALEISSRLSSLGTQLNSWADLDNSNVSLNTLKENLDESLDIYARVILDPAFPQDELERLRTQQLAAIEQEKSSPFGIGFRVLPKLIYGDGHAYSAPFSGSGHSESVAAIDVDDLRDYHRTWFKANNATLIITGDVSMDEIKGKLEAAFADMPSGDVPEKKIDFVDQASESVIYLIDRPDSEQSVILAAQTVPAYGFDGEITLEILNEVLGAGFNSRMNMNLREDKHWSYGARTSIQNTQSQRPLIAWAPVQTDKTAESVQEIHKEMSGIGGENPVTPAELDRSLKKRTLTLPGRWETLNAVEADIAEMVTYGLPDGYWNAYADEVRKVQLEDVRAMAGELIKADAHTWVIVGDAAKFKEKLAKLGIANVVMMDVNGQVLNP